MNSIWHINSGYCYKTVKKKIEVRLNRIVRIATFSSIYTPINTMYKQLNILKISDIYDLELGNLCISYTLTDYLLFLFSYLKK